MKRLSHVFIIAAVFASSHVAGEVAPEISGVLKEVRELVEGGDVSARQSLKSGNPETLESVGRAIDLRIQKLPDGPAAGLLSVARSTFIDGAEPLTFISNQKRMLEIVGVAEDFYARPKVARIPEDVKALQKTKKWVQLVAGQMEKVQSGDCPGCDDPGIQSQKSALLAAYWKSGVKLETENLNPETLALVSMQLFEAIRNDYVEPLNAVGSLKHSLIMQALLDVAIAQVGG